MKKMRIGSVPGTLDGYFYIAYDNEQLILCPCCGRTLVSEAAARALRDAIKDGRFTWDEAMDLQSERALLEPQ